MAGSTRERLIEVAAGLLVSGGPEAVTTRSVALAAGVQAPTIYRLFGDKGGLLDAVVAHGLAAYVGDKQIDPDADPVDALRAGWELHVGFGLANPGLFRLMHTALRTPDGRAAAEAGLAVLRERVHLVAAAGRLRLPEERATELIAAAGTGVVFTLIDRSTPDGGLADAAWDAVCAVILVEPAVAVPGPAAAAVTLRAALPDLPFSPAERALLGDWLGRIGDRPPGRDADLLGAGGEGSLDVPVEQHRPGQ